MRTPPQSNRIDVCASSISSIYGKFCNIINFLFLHRTTCAHSDMHYAGSVACEGWLVRLFSTELGGQTTSSADHHRPSLWLNTTTLTSAMHYCTKYTRIPEHHQSHCIAPHLTFGAPRLVAPRFCKQTCTKVLHKVLQANLHQSFASKLAPRFCTMFCKQTCTKVLHQSLPSKLAPESGDQISPYFAKKQQQKTLIHQDLALGILPNCKK